MTKKQKKNLYRIISALVIYIALRIINVENPYLDFFLYLIPYLIVGYDVLKGALHGILNKQVFDENFLMAVATVGAIGLGEYPEAVAVMLFYQIGELFQSYAVGKSRKNISNLMDIRPDYANIEKDGELVKVDPDEVQIGDIITVVVGEKIPLDGIIVEGTSSLNTSALTGESKPRSVKVNDEVISGCINMESPLKIKTTKDFGESTVSKILDLVENATSAKSKSENFITKFAHYYTPIVCYSALAVAILPPLVNGLILGNGYNWSTWLIRALTFLVVSCPCAIVISIPLSFFGGIGGASSQGVLVKGSNYLEQLSKVKIVAFDKTGTMTKGIFEVTTIHNNEFSKEELLDYAAHGEIFTTHPIGKSIIKEYGKPLDKSRVKSVKEIPGKGIKAIIDDKTVLIGNEKLMSEYGVSIIECHDEGTIVHLALDNHYKGHIHIGDVIKPTSEKAISELKKIGIRLTVMLTGDERHVGENVAKKLNIDRVYSELLPQDKVSKVEELLKDKKEDEVLAFVGDGINDAPVLSLADIGIAMGALGSDAAIEAADVVLMDDDPLKIAKAIKIAKKCMRIVYENIFFAIGIKVACLILTAIGITNMWIAIFADVGVMVICVLNAIRVLKVKRL
ncbi:MAG: cadmium-translocating P-type ATPase [Solobacterium sp.]|nr:cadmium-translocating P-type ATPase [Solobacterium sp.]MCI7156007.1 cadmium-translocating P-type ATPase [Solobacterium sp.]MDY3794237.1 heavy metal translocating P-type ATPase [Erysipelotrichaceae bacterium]MDY5402322.1 heavy metal translocating P-type ATPase [Erysipelotrichaceae bacterium]